jgi:hypothetical protein
MPKYGKKTPIVGDCAETGQYVLRRWHGYILAANEYRL